MSLVPRQPNFYVQGKDNMGGIPTTDFDNMSDEDLRKLMNGVNALSGKAARVPPPKLPPVKQEFDLDAYFRGE